jgi:hypothetical protein
MGDVKPDAKPQDVEDDWIANFFDKCRIVSDQEMQQLWAKVLAGEANSPGAFSKRTVNLLGSLDKADAITFTNICGFCWTIGQPTPLISEFQDDIYLNAGVTLSNLLQFESLGLISIEPVSGYTRHKLKKRVALRYHGEVILVEFPSEENNRLDLGHVMLTRPGLQLASICAAKPVEGFKEYCLEKWKGESLFLSSPYPRLAPAD